VRATRADGAETLSMPFYLRATRVNPAPASLNAIGDDSPADQIGGVDRDGRYVISWTYPASEPARPCAYRIEEAVAGGMGTLWFDDGEELLTNSGNSKWAAALWTTRPHLNTGTLGYSAAYVDGQSMTLTMKQSVALPNSVVLLSFESDEDLEPDFDYGYLEVSTDEGASWITLQTFNGAFFGVRTFNLTNFAGQSIRLRFRAVTDQLVSTPVHLGWSVDDIRIQAGATFSPLATVASSQTSYNVAGKADGGWAHRVVALFDCGTNAYGTTPSNVETITVSNATAPPTASFTSERNPSNAAESVTFDASASADHDDVNGGGIARYQWSFGDGATATTSTPVTAHAYAAPGTYRVALTVVDDDEESASAESLQTVREANANISAGGWIPSANKHADFSVSASQTDGFPGGSVYWNDKKAKTIVQSTRITRIERSGNVATIHGEGTLNKRDATTFVITLTDNGASGDTASMQAGTYANSGTVQGGDVSVQ
jgi:PKD repeat protein